MTTIVKDVIPVPETLKIRKKVPMTEKALENLKKAREILKAKREEAKATGVKLVSKRKIKKDAKAKAAAAVEAEIIKEESVTA